MTLIQRHMNVDATYDVASTFVRHCINVMCPLGWFRSGGGKVDAFLEVFYEGESISNQPTLLPSEIELFFCSRTVYLAQRCTSANITELKNSKHFAFTRSLTTHILPAGTHR